MDETGHSGDTGSAESGGGADSRDRALLNGWATSDSAWSNAGSALDPEEDVPSWRRASPEIRPFTRQNFPLDRPVGEARPFTGPDPATEVRPFGSPPNPFGDDSRPGEIRSFGDSSQSGEVRPFADSGASGEVRPFGDHSRSGEVRPFVDSSRSGEIRNFADSSRSGEVRPPADPAPVPPEAGPQAPDGPAPQWSDPSRRYADLLHHFAPGNRPDSLEDDDRRRPLSPLDAPPPNSAPPYPYEGDLDDEPPANSPVVQQRAAVPLERPQRIFPAVRPAAPDARRNDWSALSTGSWPAAEPARHALAPNPPATTGSDASGADTPARTSYDPSTFPRRLPRDPAGPPPPADPSPADAAPTAFSGFTGRSADDTGGTPIGDLTARALPQRVPAQPDVPTVPEPPSVEPPAETPALARIATHLRRGDVLSSHERQEGFDVNAILAAVREVDGVRDASLRSTPAGAHSLRLDLAEGADPAEVSRQVARLLQDRMGLDAAMQGATATGAAQVPSAPISAPPVSAPPVSAPPVSGPPIGAPPAPFGAAPVNTAPLSAFVPSQSGSAGRATVPNTGAATARGDDLRRLPTAPQAGPGPIGTRESVITPAQISPAAPAAAPVSPAIAAPVSPAIAAPVSPAIAAAAAQAAPVRPTSSAAAGSATATRPVTAGPATGETGTVETVTSGVDCTTPRPLDIRERPGPRVVIENVQVNTFGTEATVEVRLAVGTRTAAGIASGPSVDGYLLRLCATATAGAVDELLASSDHSDGPARCYVEHAASVAFGPMQVAVVVLLLSCGGTWVEQLAGSAVVSGDDRHAMVRATLAAVNRRLEALLS